MSTRQERLENALRTTFHPSMLAVIDESASHAGHAGASSAGETHYRIEMTAEAFVGQSRLARSRAVHAAVADEFGRGLHALSLSLRTQAETAGKQVPSQK